MIYSVSNILMSRNQIGWSSDFRIPSNIYFCNSLVTLFGAGRTIALGGCSYRSKLSYFVVSSFYPLWLCQCAV